jgi:DNA primase
LIKQDSIENLKSNIDVVDVVSSYIEIKKSGSNFKALCPFHGEKTPSMVISPSKQIFHCFGCGIGGDGIKFTMEYENLSYPEAIEKLATTYNIQLEYDKNFKKKETKALEQTNLYFKKNLDNNSEAMKYLEDRGISHSSIEKFELGYAPDSNSTINYLNANHISLHDATEQGLLGQGDNRYYSRFIERITFPIYTPHDKLCGFGGRTISNHPAKYINSPQSTIFNKSKLMYGYSKAKDAIFKQKKIVVTEGYLDVIMLHQVGFNNVVATLGTALTKEHLPLLRRGEPKVILAYDGDSAGINAAFKAASMLTANSIEGGVVLFKEGIDPADMVKDGKIEELNTLLSNPKALIPFCLETIVQRYDTKVPEEKQKALNDANSYISTLSPILQEEYKKYLANILNINEQLVKTTLNKYSKDINFKTESFAELSLIKTIIEHPTHMDSILNTLDPIMFESHSSEFHSLITNINSDELPPELMGISLREDIKVYNEYELKNQLIFFLRKFYQNELKKVSTLKIDFHAKTYLIRKLRFYIEKLKKLELVEFDDELVKSIKS